MQFLKKFFRLRRKGGKQRKTGYYWVGWQIPTKESTGFIVALYNADTDTWIIPGRVRFYKDTDFLFIDGNQVTPFPWSLLSKIILIAAWCCIVISVIMTVINTIHDYKHLTK